MVNHEPSPKFSTAMLRNQAAVPLPVATAYGGGDQALREWLCHISNAVAESRRKIFEGPLWCSNWNLRDINSAIGISGTKLVDHDFMEFWIQVHGIPLDHMNKETEILIGGMLKVLAEAEDPKVDGVLRRSFLRIRVSINITKTLSTDNYCFNCEILGHEKKTCKNPTAMTCWDPTKKKYSPGLGVSQVRPILAIGGGGSKQHRWREEEEEQVRDQQNLGRESREEQSTKESRIRAKQNLQ
ncbi:hypothetical protein Ahy_B06g083733 [Arachis hypogaea]|uniref:CCHC-type domain-containing protein n=1 Tax=Arachis hypogaea TaxID=3818 RepID=A0A444YQI9_ARAHY|nr:hypothetical protein Ahy_B06g083733 [Arachis hypogaea]